MLVPVRAAVPDVKAGVPELAEATVQSRAAQDAEAAPTAVQQTAEEVAALHAVVGAADIVMEAVPVVAAVVAVAVIAVVHVPVVLAALHRVVLRVVEGVVMDVLAIVQGVAVVQVHVLDVVIVAVVQQAALPVG